MAQGRWFRLDVGWDDVEWVSDLSPLAQLAWVKMQAHVKAQGVRGRARALSPRIASKRWGVTPDAVRELIEAGCAAAPDTDEMAIVLEDGDWIITHWQERQEPDAAGARERKRKQRARMREESQQVTGVTDVTRDVTPGHAGHGRPVARDSDIDKDRDLRTNGNGSSAHSVRSRTGAGRAGSFPQNVESVDWTPGRIMALARLRLHLGQPLPGGRNEAQEFNTIETMLGKGIPAPRLAQMILDVAEYRDDGECVLAGPAKPLTMGALYSNRGLRPLVNRAEEHVQRKLADAPARASPDAHAEQLGAILARVLESADKSPGGD